MEAGVQSAAWLQHWLYDWNGPNLLLFQAINFGLPDTLVWLPVLLSAVGSYWGAPAVVAGLLAVRRASAGEHHARVTAALFTFLFALCAAMSLTALMKSGLQFPRPSEVLAGSAFRLAENEDSRYTLPSGHATYVAVVTGSMLPLVQRLAAAALLLSFCLAVGWSRIALGAHFPADVLAGFAVGAGCALLLRPVGHCAATRLQEVSLRPQITNDSSE
jgi:membrane-associated phospholipid phosphatase